MLQAKVKTIIQILIMFLKEHIFLSQIDIEVSRFLTERNSSSSSLITKTVLTLSSGNSNLVKTAQPLFLKIILTVN